MTQEKFNSLKQGDRVRTVKGEVFIFEKSVRSYTERRIGDEVHISQPYYIAYCFRPYTNNDSKLARYFPKEDLR